MIDIRIKHEGTKTQNFYEKHSFQNYHYIKHKA